MKTKLLQMPAVRTAPAFSRTVPTIEQDVNFNIQSIANEDGTCPLCVVDLPNQGPTGGFCRAYLDMEHIDALIAALNAYKALP